MGDYTDGLVYRCADCKVSGTRKEVSWVRCEDGHHRCSNCWENQEVKRDAELKHAAGAVVRLVDLLHRLLPYVPTDGETAPIIGEAKDFLGQAGVEPLEGRTALLLTGSERDILKLSLELTEDQARCGGGFSMDGMNTLRSILKKVRDLD